MSATHDPHARHVYAQLAYAFPNVRGYFNALCMTHECTADPREVYAASLRATARLQVQAASDKQEPPRLADREGSTNSTPRTGRKWSLTAA